MGGTMHRLSAENERLKADLAAERERRGAAEADGARMGRAVEECRRIVGGLTESARAEMIRGCREQATATCICGAHLSTAQATSPGPPKIDWEARAEAAEAERDEAIRGNRELTRMLAEEIEAARSHGVAAGPGEGELLLYQFVDLASRNPDRIAGREGGRRMSGAIEGLPQYGRLRLMADEPLAWGHSDEDTRAIRWALALIESLEAERGRISAERTRMWRYRDAVREAINRLIAIAREPGGAEAGG